MRHTNSLSAAILRATSINSAIYLRNPRGAAPSQYSSVNLPSKIACGNPRVTWAYFTDSKEVTKKLSVTNSCDHNYRVPSCLLAAEQVNQDWHGDWNFQMMPHTGLPYPEDAISIQHVLAQTMGMMLNRHITPEQARAVAVLCRELRQNLARFEWEMKRYQLISGEEPGEARAPYLP
jgi:hypothetical protein